MSLATYSGLIAALPRWLRRDDLTTDIPDFITLAEAQINRRLRDAKVMGRTTITVDAEYVDVPSDFGGAVSFDLETSPATPLEGYAAHELAELVATRYQATGKPLAYAVVGGEFRFAPSPAESYTAALTYYQRVPPLSEDAPTNWLLTKHPDAYLYGALLQAAPYLRADDRMQTWGALFGAALEDIVTEVERDRFGARPARRMRSLG